MRFPVNPSEAMCGLEISGPLGMSSAPPGFIRHGVPRLQAQVDIAREAVHEYLALTWRREPPKGKGRVPTTIQVTYPAIKQPSHLESVLS